MSGQTAAFVSESEVASRATVAEEYTGPERRAADRRSVVDRRSALDRRRGPGRRRTDIRREAEEGEMSGELLEFVLAIDEYKRVNSRPFPSWSEVFEVIRYLGYRKVADTGAHINEPAACVKPEEEAANPQQI